MTIYFDTEKQAYSNKQTLLNWGKTYLTECTDEQAEDLQKGKLIFDEKDNLVENPNYEKQKQQEEKQARNAEIDSKIKELQQMALPEILQGNTANVKLYNEVIQGLNNAKL